MKYFTHETHEYKRDIEIIDNYIAQQALYLQRMTGKSFEQCKDFVKRQIGEDGRHAMNNPETRFLYRQDNGDRKGTTTNFRRYLDVIKEKNLIVAPTLTTYLPTTSRKSLIAEYIGDNMKERSATKKTMFKYKMIGDESNENFYDLLQSTFKIKNNSVSGAHASPHQVLYNKSSHSTLTSVCRTGTSYANANNERFLMGNRHYWSPEIARSNILSVITITDREAFQKAMDIFDVHYPTTDEAAECLLYSTNLYWRNEYEQQRLIELLDSLEPIERAMFVYVGDMYHLSKYNPTLVYQLLTDFVREDYQPVEDPDFYLDQLGDDAEALVSFLCYKHIAGYQFGDLKKEFPDSYVHVGACAKNILDTLDRYYYLIRGFWVTENLPPSIFKVPSMYRRCAIVSDTDSTIFTTQQWTSWYTGQIDFSDTSYAVGHVMTFLASQLVIHQLATMSANMGVAEDQIHQLSMKSEFYFPVLALTSMAKNYYSYISGQEGNVFDEWDVEIKGVSLRSSNWPAEITKRLKEYMMYLMDNVIQKGTMSYDEILRPVYEVEREILDDIDTGGTKYLTTTQVKSADSYTADPDQSPYKHHDLWQCVFAPKYGDADELPYQTVKVSVLLNRPTDMRRWLECMEDRDLAQRMSDWMTSNHKDKIAMFRLPESVVRINGVPKEIIDVIDRRSLLYNTISGFYLVLESMGLYMLEDSKMRFVSDFYQP